MSRDPSGIYTVPAGTDGIPDTTIESAKYNGFVHDVEQDLNIPRPIVAGGTGATSASQARDNLDAEVAMALVANYDTHAFENGSFNSATSATNPPVAGHRFGGTAKVLDPGTNQFIQIEARDLDDTMQPGRVWARQKKDGMWSAWTLDGGSGTFVLKTGDTMTGVLTMATAVGVNPGIIFNRPDNSTINIISGAVANSLRWQIRIPNFTANADFTIHRYSDAGVELGIPFSIERSTGYIIGTSRPVFPRLLTGSGTYTPSAGVVRLHVRMVGGGGGGQGGGNGAVGGTGGATSFAGWTANGGNGIAGGSCGGSGLQVFFQGGQGQFPAHNTGNSTGGMGAASPFGGSGAGVWAGNVGSAGVALTGAGGGGGGSNGTAAPGCGGGAGGYIEGWIQPVAASYAYAVGAGGAGTAGGTGGVAGGNGGSGFLIVEEFFI